MMKVLVVLLFAALAIADVSYTGYLVASTPTAFLPNSGSPCTAGTSPYSYIAFNETFSAAGVRTIQVLGSSVDYVTVYRGSFNPAAPCTNVVDTYAGNSRYLSGTNDNSPVLDFSGAYFFEADTYIFVLLESSASTTASSSNVFGVSVIEPVSTTQIPEVGSTWKAPYQSATATLGNSGITLSSLDEVYTSYVFTAPATGLYDVGAFAANSTAETNPQISLGIFTGAVTATQISGSTFTGTNYFPYDNHDEAGVWVYYVSMTQGTQYTFVASNENRDPTNVGFFVTPTRASTFTDGNDVSLIFTEPERDSAPGTSTAAYPECEVSDNTGRFYAVRTLQAVGNIVVAESADSATINEYMSNELEGIDFETFMYRGVNNTAPSQPCTIAGNYVGAVDSGSISSLAAGASVHTIIVTSWSTSRSNSASTGVLVQSFYGQNLNGPNAATPTPTPAPATPTPTPAPATTGATPAPATTNANNNGAGSTTSGAVSVVSSIAFAGVAVATLLL